MPAGLLSASPPPHTHTLGSRPVLPDLFIRACACSLLEGTIAERAITYALVGPARPLPARCPLPACPLPWDFVSLQAAV